jgi:hypothetical protein
VQGGDRGLHLVRADRSTSEGSGQDRLALPDPGGVPKIAALFVQRHQAAIGPGTGGPARVGEQHQREQARDLALAREQPVGRAGQPDSLGGQVRPLQRRSGAGGVPLVEDEVKHVQHHTQPLGTQRFLRQFEAGSRGADALFRPADPLADGGLGDEERGGDLGRGQSTDRAERKGKLGRRRQRGMATQEQQGEGVVAVNGGCLVGRVERCGGFAAAPGAVGSPLVDQGPAGHRQQPGVRPLRYTVNGPLPDGGEQRLLHGVLAHVELPIPAHERREDPRRALAQQVLDTSAGHRSVASSMIRRISIGNSV